jgi:hypothetical protein
MARVRLLNGIHRQRPDRVDRKAPQLILAFWLLHLLGSSARKRRF